MPAAWFEDQDTQSAVFVFRKNPESAAVKLTDVLVSSFCLGEYRNHPASRRPVAEEELGFSVVVKVAYGLLQFDAFYTVNYFRGYRAGFFERPSHPLVGVRNHLVPSTTFTFQDDGVFANTLLGGAADKQ